MDQSLHNQASAPQSPPKNWLVESILATIFCCLPFGVVGIIFASQVNNKFAQGDYEGAMKASSEAGRWTKVSFFVSLAGIIIGLIFLFAFGGWALLQSRSNSNF